MPGNLDRRDHDVAEVGAGGRVEGSAAGNHAEFRRWRGPVDLRGGKPGLEVQAYLQNPERDQRSVRTSYQDQVAVPEQAQAEEHAGPEVGVDMPGDDGGADLARARAAGVPARHRGGPRNLQSARSGAAESDQAGPYSDRGNE